MTNVVATPPSHRVRAYGAWCDTGKRVRKIAACAYAFSIPELMDEQVFWGRGGEKDAQVMLAHMIPHLVNVVAHNRDDTGIILFVRKRGTDRYFTHHIWTWLAKESRKEPVGLDRYDIWKKAYHHVIVGSVELRKASDHDLSRHIEPLLAAAMRQAGLAEEAREHYQLGLAVTSEGKLEA